MFSPANKNIIYVFDHYRKKKFHGDAPELPAITRNIDIRFCLVIGTKYGVSQNQINSQNELNFTSDIKNHIKQKKLVPGLQLF